MAEVTLYLFGNNLSKNIASSLLNETLQNKIPILFFKSVSR